MKLFDFESVDGGDGWYIGSVGLYLLNESASVVNSGTLTFADARVLTEEGKVYPAVLQRYFVEGDRHSFHLADPHESYERTFGEPLIQEIDLAHTPLPPGLLTWYYSLGDGLGSQLDYGSFEAVFRYAYAATPTTLVLTTMEYGDLHLDLRSSGPIVDPVASVVRSRPISTLGEDEPPIGSTAVVTFTGVRVEHGDLEWAVMVDYSVTNHDLLDEHTVLLDTMFAAYSAGGRLYLRDVFDPPREITVGPGQTVSDFVLVTCYDENRPLFLVSYANWMDPLIYDLDTLSD